MGEIIIKMKLRYKRNNIPRSRKMDISLDVDWLTNGENSEYSGEIIAVFEPNAIKKRRRKRNKKSKKSKDRD